MSINNICKVRTLKDQSKGRYLPLKKSFFKDYNKWLVGTTQHSSRVRDITNPKIFTFTFFFYLLIFNLHKPRPWEHAVHVEKRKNCCSRAHLLVCSSCRIRLFMQCAASNYWLTSDPSLIEHNGAL